MKPYFGILSLIVIFASCRSKDPTDPFTYWNRERQQEIAMKLVRYAAKLPPNSNHSVKFNTEFDPYYKSVAIDYNFMWVKQEPDGSYYFLFSRPARSATPLFEGIGGKLKLNDQDSLVLYNEIFRTWKMTDKDLRERGKTLFDEMVAGKDLTVFYSKNMGDKFIEFPDDRFYFDVEERKWKDSVFDSLDLERD